MYLYSVLYVMKCRVDVTSHCDATVCIITDVYFVFTYASVLQSTVMQMALLFVLRYVCVYGLERKHYLTQGLSGYVTENLIVKLPILLGTGNLIISRETTIM